MRWAWSATDGHCSWCVNSGWASTGSTTSRANTGAHAAEWALFTDWCTATSRVPLPAQWDTVAAFNTGCPGAPATIRRRLAAIAHHHRTAE